MISAFLVSAVFLGFYLYYHSHYPPRIFAGTGFIRPVYFAMLISHIILAVGVLPFILRLLWAAHKGDFTRHKKLARVVYPVWIYTSLTGVLVYLFLYQWFTNEAFTSTGGL